MKDCRFSNRHCRRRRSLMNAKQKLRPQMRLVRSSRRRSASRERSLDHSYMRSGHGKELSRNRSPQPPRRFRSISPPLICRDGDDRLKQNHLLSEHSSFNTNWRSWGQQSPPPIKDRDLRTQISEFLPHAALDFKGHDMQSQKSNFIGEGSSRSLYPDHSLDSIVLCSEPPKYSAKIFSTGKQESEVLSYVDHSLDSIVLCSEPPKYIAKNFSTGKQESEVLSYNKEPRDHYDDMDRQHIHSRTLPITKMDSSSEMRPFSSMPSYSLLKEDAKGFNRNHISEGIATDMGRYPNPPSEHYSCNQLQEPESLRHAMLDDSKILNYHELSRRSLDEHRIRMHDEPYKRLPHISRTELSNTTSSTILDYGGDWMAKAESPKKNLMERPLPDHYHFYDDVRDQQMLLTHSGKCCGWLRGRSSRDFEEKFSSENDFISASYRAEHRRKRPLISYRDRSHMDDFCGYDMEVMESTDYAIIEHINENNSRIKFVNDEQFLAPYEGEEMWLTEKPPLPSLSKQMFSKHPQYIKLSRGYDISNLGVFMPSSGSRSKLAKSDHSVSLKKRLKEAHFDLYTPLIPERRQYSSNPDKDLKRGMQARLGAQDRGAHEGGTYAAKNDPPEESEEFKKQVHASFLRFSKLLNESPSSQKLYKKQGNTHRLLCIVCGSISREFLDTICLVTHCYHSHKAGLKTEHLGFHKAVCVLMGWNWLVPPDATKAYQSVSVSEVKSMRQDLILWPPVVIIHNYLVAVNSSTVIAKTVTVETIEKMLRDMGFGAGLAGVYLGKPTNESIFIVKFVPTFSGFQTAERLHKHFIEKSHGKQEFQQIFSNKKEAENQSKQMEEMLYGYIAVAEDLNKLDPKILKKILIKSKKDDVEAIANALLNAC